MFNTKQSLQFASLLLCLILSPYSAIAQTVTEESDPIDAGSKGLIMPGNAERLGVQEVGIQDFKFEPQNQSQNQPQPQLRQIENIGLKREQEVRLVPPPNRQHTVYEDTAGVQVQVRPKQKKAKPDF